MTFSVLQLLAAVCISLLIGLVLGHAMRNDVAYGVGYLEGRVAGWREHRDNPSARAPR